MGYSVVLAGLSHSQKPNWRYANNSKVSRLIFVNKLDRIGADFLKVTEQNKKVLGAKPLIMTLPIGIEDNFIGVVDLLTRKALRFGMKQGNQKIIPLPTFLRIWSMMLNYTVANSLKQR